MFVAVVLGLICFGCGGEEAPPPDTGDGKVHPPASGERTTEALACDTLINTHGKQMLAQGCVGTSPTCPAFLRSEFNADCLQYDKGSVDGCLEFYKTKTTCDDLRKALDECVITAYTDSAPAGCP
jgi:hypothetical protein